MLCQEDSELGAGSHFRRYTKLAAMAVHHMFHDGEPEAGSSFSIAADPGTR